MTSSAVQMGAAHGKMQLAPDKQPMHAEDVSEAAAVDAPVAELRMSPEVPSHEQDKKLMHPHSMQASLAAPDDGTADSSAMQQPESHNLAAAPEQPRLSAEQVFPWPKPLCTCMASHMCTVCNKGIMST